MIAEAANLIILLIGLGLITMGNSIPVIVLGGLACLAYAYRHG